MSVSGIQGLVLEATVVGCNKLKDTEWFSRQDPYVCLEYGSTRFRTRTCTDGGKTPTFQEKFTFTLIEGLRDLSVVVWNSNTLSTDDFIGSGKIQLQKVLSQGYDDSSWTIQTKSGRYAGEVRLILHFGNANKPSTTGYVPQGLPYAAPPMPQPSLYSAPPPPPPHSTGSHYQQHSTAYPSPYPSYPQHNGGGYPPSSYPPPPPTTYPPSPYPPTSTYPPPSSAYPQSSYPPPPQSAPYYPPSPFPGLYPPRPY